MSIQSEDLELGNYRVLHKKDGSLWMLGRGGYGTTYKAEHKHLGRNCALKVINDNLMRNNDAKRRFLQEAQAAALLDHPHIARVYDFGEANGIFYYAMTYCAGGDLEEFSKSSGPQSWDTVKEFALQILTALGAAHTNGLLHRDLKPSNIMLADDDGTVSLRLIDFGLVKVLEHHESASTNLMLTQEGSFIGNPLTASPEQLREEELDERSDLFSLGITLWYLLTGSSPFGGIATAELVHQRLSDESYESKLPENLDDEGKQILSKLLNKDITQRYRNAEEVIQAIESGSTAAMETNTEEKTASQKPAKKEAPLTRDSEPSVVNIAAPRDWSEIWEIHAQLKKFNYGTYYYCAGLVSGVPGTTLFVPDGLFPYVESVSSHADKILNADTHLLNGFYQKGKLSSEPAYVSPPFPSGDLQCLLHVFDHLSLQDHLTVFQQIATAVDESIAKDIPGVELDITDVLLGARENTNEAAQTHAEWHEFFQQQKDAGKDCTANLEITLLPKLVDSADIEEAMVTIGNDDLAANPVARFGGLIYRTVSGMSVKQSAYLSPSAHVSTSNISEESNRYLSEVISAREMPASAMEMLKYLCTLEGVEWHTETLEATLQTKDRRRDEATLTHASMSSLLAKHPAPTKSPPSIPEDQSSKTTKQNHSPSTQTKVTAPTESNDQKTETQTPASELGKAPQTNQSTGSQKTSTTPQTAPTPLTTNPQVATPEPPTKATPPKIKKSSKGAVIGISISALALLTIAAGGLGWWFFLKDKNPEQTTSSSNSETTTPQTSNPLTLRFTDVALVKTELPSAATYAISDQQGNQLAEFIPSEGKVEITNIPAALFDDTDRWPLKLELAAEGFTMNPITLSKISFSNTEGNSRNYSSRIKLEARAYTDATPTVKYNGNALQLTIANLKNHLHPEDPSLDWKLEEHDSKLRVILPPGANFPIKALVIFPGMEELTFDFEQNSQPEWNLALAKREIKLTGLGNFSSMKFSPDYSKLPNSIIKKTLQENPLNPTALASDFSNGTGTWVLPSLPGQIQVTGNPDSWSFAIDTDTKFRVLTNSDRSGSTELGDNQFLQLSKRAQRGELDSQYELGLAYLKGAGVKKDATASTEWFRMAALQGDKAAQHNLALAYELGSGVPVNQRDAVKWYAKAAKQGYPDSQMGLALCYQQGRGVKRDFKKAEELFASASNQGSAPAMFNLAILYEDATANMVDKVRAIELYHKAAELGHPGALYNLAWSYENGEGGLTKNLEKALELYRKAAEKGSVEAKKALQSLE